MIRGVSDADAIRVFFLLRTSSALVRVVPYRSGVVVYGHVVSEQATACGNAG